MRRRIFALAAVLAIVGLIGAVPVVAGEAASTVSTFEIDGMTCGGCSAAVRLAVKKMEGVQDVEVDHDGGSATVKYDSEKVSTDAIVEAIEKQGFEAKVTTTEAA